MAGVPLAPKQGVFCAPRRCRDSILKEYADWSISPKQV